MDFSALQAYLDHIDTNLVPACRVTVMQNNQRLFRYFTAREDLYEQEKEKSLFYLFSASKVITCTAALRLVERGVIGLDDPVKKYLPAFEKLTVRTSEGIVPAKNVLTVRHLFTMTGGFTYNLGDPVLKNVLKDDPHASTRTLVDALASSPLIFEPGTRFNYSLCHDILAAVVEEAAGCSFGEFLKKEIFDPLGMKDTTFRFTPAIGERMHAQFSVNQARMTAWVHEPQCPYTLSDTYESGGAGLISSDDDYAVFADALATGTSKDGYRLLKKETIDLFRSDQLSEQVKPSYAQANRVGYSYALGVRTLIDPAAAQTLAPVGEFGWDGAAGAFVVIDPENKLSLFYSQHVLGCGYVYNHVHFAIRNLMYDALKK